MKKQEAFKEAYALNQFPAQHVYAHCPNPDYDPDHWEVRIVYLYQEADDRVIED